MPTRMIAARELAKFFGVFSHPDRVRIVEALREGCSLLVFVGGLPSVSTAAFQGPTCSA